MSKIKDNKEVVLDNVSLKEEIQNLNGLAIMLEQDDGNYKESSSNSWPTDMYFNEELSGCVDNLGNKLENTLTYENGIANVETSDTSYCVLYFNKTTNLNYLCKNYENIDECENNENLENVKGIWNSTLEDDGYRYVGTNPDNYICFGTTNQEECTSNTDKYMYRIIGIFEDEEGQQHLKLIKKEALNTAYAWHSDNTTDTNWDKSDLYKGLNGSYFATNKDYSYMQDSVWNNLITNWSWTATNTQTYYKRNLTSNFGVSYYHSTSIGIYNSENQIDTTTGCYQTDGGIAINCKTTASYTYPKGKISLMYASDYVLSLGETVVSIVGSTMANSSILKTGWMYIGNNDSSPEKYNDWTMSRYGYDGYNYYAFSSVVEGYISTNDVLITRVSRPVFYLTENIKITSGKGSITEPFIIS